MQSGTCSLPRTAHTGGSANVALGPAHPAARGDLEACRRRRDAASAAVLRRQRKLLQHPGCALSVVLGLGRRAPRCSPRRAASGQRTALSIGSDERGGRRPPARLLRADAVLPLSLPCHALARGTRRRRVRARFRTTDARRGRPPRRPTASSRSSATAPVRSAVPKPTRASHSMRLESRSDAPSTGRHVWIRRVLAEA